MWEGGEGGTAIMIGIMPSIKEGWGGKSFPNDAEMNRLIRVALQRETDKLMRVNK